MGKPLVYVESSVISHLASRPTKDVIRRAIQLQTSAWWSLRDRFELLVSVVVLIEAGQGTPEAAARRRSYCTGLRTAELADRSRILARDIIRRTGLPESAEADSLHIAIAACENADFLVTWNLKHIAGAAHQPRIESACIAAGVRKPVICTPPQLMEVRHA